MIQLSPPNDQGPPSHLKAVVSFVTSAKPLLLGVSGLDTDNFQGPFCFLPLVDVNVDPGRSGGIEMWESTHPLGKSSCSLILQTGDLPTPRAVNSTAVQFTQVSASISSP